MKIRKATTEEIFAIANLAKNLDEYYEKQVKIFDKWAIPNLQRYINHIENLFDQGYTVLIAIEDDGLVVGYIAGKTFIYDYDGKVHGKIEELFVREEYRHKGIGGRLEDEIEDAFRENNAVGIFASVFTRNVNSLRFHQNRGFETVEEYIDLHKDLK